MVIKCLSTWDTDYCADTVEWCPEPNLNDVFAVGTYQVVNDPENTTFDGDRQRKGRLLLGEFEDTIQIKETLETQAILDLKWSPSDSKLLASVDAGGQLIIYSLEENPLSLKRCQSYDVVDNLLALSLDWKHDKIAVSDAGGYISVVASDTLESIIRCKSHDFEAWITCFDAFDSNLLFSGGDDTKLKGHDIRTGSSSFVCKDHSAGVTSLLSHPNVEHKLFSGSYDEILREWDTRKMKSCLNEVPLGGGVWRIKYNQLKNILGTACMHNGYHLLEEEGGKICDSFMEHESLAYGLDWHRSRSNLGATCSFYDHQLKIWELVE